MSEKTAAPAGVFPSAPVWAMETAHYERMLRSAATFTFTADLKPESLAARADVPLQVLPGGVGLIRIRGVMDKLPSLFLQLYGGTSTAAVRRTVEAAARDPKVSAILLAIDSPGGSVDGLAELGDAILAAREVKPVVAQVDGWAASAAYYAASQATKIYAHRMDMVGSIGVRLGLYDWHRLFEKEGVEAVPIDTGEHKSAGMQGTEITEAQRAEFQRVVDGYFADFKAAVRRARNVPELDALADGRMFFAAEAVESGLIDGVQSFEETLAGFAPSAAAPRRSRADLAIRMAEAE